MKPRIAIWGTGGHAKVVAEIISLRGEFRLAGFIDNINPAPRDSGFCEARVLGGVEQLAELAGQGVRDLVFGFGHCAERLRKSRLVRERGIRLATAIHPRSVVASDVVVGSGTVVAGGAVINPGARVGENVIVNTNATVEHDCRLDDGVHVCPGTHLGGHTRVGSGSWIGIGSVVKDRVTIGAGCLVGAGSLVLRDVPDRTIVFGHPARVIRKVADGFEF